MAKIKYSALVSDMRNKLNGSVLSKNRYGSYVRNKTTPTNEQTDAQVNVRARLAQFSQAWRGLTEAQRNAWKNAVSEWARTDIFGDLHNPTGSNLYTRVNMNIENAGGTPVLIPPSKVGVEPLASISITADVSTPELEVTFTATPVPADCVVVLDFTEQVGAGISFVKNKYRQLIVVPTAGTSPVNALSAYTAKFGNLQAGKKIFVRGKVINKTTGEVSQPLSAMTIVVP